MPSDYQSIYESMVLFKGIEEVLHEVYAIETNKARFQCMDECRTHNMQFVQPKVYTTPVKKETLVSLDQKL